MRFDQVPEPADFDGKVRQRGGAWLASHSGNTDLPTYWSPYRRDLADGFHQLCAYCVMTVAAGEGEIDHFRNKRDHPELAYEWCNYRFASGRMNQKKHTADVLDPFTVQDDWFKILLPSLQLVLTDAVPEELRPLAELTIRRLGLQDDPIMREQRAQWYEPYRHGHIDFEHLQANAPLVARAVEAEQSDA